MTVRDQKARKSIAIATAMLAVAAAGGGCGEQQSDGAGVSGSASPSAVSTVAPDLVRMRSVSEEEGVGTVEVIADGNRRYRITASSDARVEYFQVWDGKAMLFYVPEEFPKYQRMENPDKAEFPIMSFFYRPGTDEFGQLCPAAKRLGTKTLFGRTAVRYHCDEVASSETTGPLDAREIALDEETGLLMLNGGPEVLTEVTFGPAINSDTFSTELPPGVDSSEVTPDSEPTDVPSDGGEIGPYEIGTFRLRAVGGGFVDGTTYRGKPFVIVAGPADGIRTALGRLSPMTRAGKPPVVGFLMVLPAEDWKGSLLNPEDVKELADSVSKSAGTFAVPVGLDFKGVASGMFTGNITEPSDLTQVTIALVTSDGTFAHVTPAREVTDSDLRTWIVELF